VGGKLDRSRSSRRAPATQDEQSAMLAVYRLLDKGVRIPTAYQGIGVAGFRKHQTCLSVANPGEGHVRVTCSAAAAGRHHCPC
jgi:hypothetical protein